MTRFRSCQAQLTSYIVEEAISVLVDIVIKTAAKFREKGRTETPEHLGLTGLAGFLCPEPLLHTLWRQGFKLRLRNKFTKAVRDGLEQMANHVYEMTIPARLSSELLDEHLWIDEGLRNDIHAVFKPEVSVMIWRFILQALSHGLGNVEQSEIQDQLANPQLNYTWLGQSLAELFTVWGAALQGALWKARQSVQEMEILTHEETLERVWINARDGALEAAKNAVSKTREVIQDYERDSKWEGTWSAWDECWQNAYKIAQPLLLESVEKIVNKLVSFLTDTVLEDMKNDRCDTIRTYKQRKRFPNLTKNVDLQDYMQNIIKNNTINVDALSTVETSMERIWKGARLPLKVSTFDSAKSAGAWHDAQTITCWGALGISPFNTFLQAIARDDDDWVLV
ncbi:hypothetical protein RhiJN_11876 [Ceratobasidium sp. AG-Ba]|nr:hypothetical protein RhiJN_11876 [Ceratobasidium sp. AG-Ba]